jgi:chorismate synthase
LSNTFGQLLRVTTFGESHGPAIGCVVDGCPPGIEIAADDFAHDLARRATGRTRHTSARHEDDAVEILSGVYEGRTTGTPIALLVRNTDARSKDYDRIARQFRPGHADYTYWHKYGARDPRGGGRSSARETTMRVAAAVIAKKWLAERFGVRVRGHLAQIGDVIPRSHDWGAVEGNPFFWPDAGQVAELEAFMDALRKSGDSVGARVTVVADGVPPGWGEPIYGKLDGELAGALMSINAVKGVEVVTHGRHDPCVGVRATPICEAMVALVLMDQALRHRAQCGDVGDVAPRIKPGKSKR